MMLLPSLVLLLSLVSCKAGDIDDMSHIPNGFHIANPCKLTERWADVVNQDPLGVGALDRFGQDLYNNNNVWNATVCQLDSDFDGRTNGVELGDPNCVWKIGNEPEQTTGMTHPGVCEPITSDKCIGMNSWLACASYKCPAFNLTTTQNVSLVFPTNARVPAQDDSYVCKGFQLPSELPYHVVGTTPIIDKPSILQQMILFGCDKPITGALLLSSQPCRMGVSNCRTPIAAWNMGSPGQCYSEQFGFPIGVDGYQYAVLQLHWKNPKKLANLQERSGIALYYTSVLRPNPAQIVMVGQEDIKILPNQASTSFTGGCVKDCTRLLPTSIYIPEAFLHMHQQGKSGSLQLIKDGTVSTLLNEPSYNYNVPTILYLKKAIEFRAGDELRVNCEFQTLKKNTTTNFGSAATDEMCYGFITVYPAIPSFTRCSQWRELPLCPLSPTVTYSNCNLTSFPTYFDPILEKCDSNCSDICKNLTAGIMATKCLNGNTGAWFTEFQTATYPKLPSVMNLTQACQPVTSTTTLAMTTAFASASKATKASTTAFASASETTIASSPASSPHVNLFSYGTPYKILSLTIVFAGVAIVAKF